MLTQILVQKKKKKTITTMYKIFRFLQLNFIFLLGTKTIFPEFQKKMCILLDLLHLNQSIINLNFNKIVDLKNHFSLQWMDGWMDG
jgi:hypothetical protein